jgi:drug/metabolite transporter (DMT)-like permease
LACIHGKTAPYLAISIVSLGIGYLFTIQTVRVGDLSVSTPFRYTVLLGAVVIGYLLFDEVPNRFTIAGSLIIIATGVYAVHLERIRSSHIAESLAAEPRF